jgi:phosphatidylglycerophosphate synthase
MGPHTIPYALIWFRGVAGLAILALCMVKAPLAPVLSTILLALGVLTDIFDGVIARRLNVVTPDLRLWDSRCDVVFWVCAAVGLHILWPDLWATTWIMVATLVVLEMIPRVISHVRFRKEASTHHLMSKIFTLFLWALLSQLFLTGEVGFLFWVTWALGIISQCEAIAIMAIIPKWACDIKSLKVALDMRARAKVGLE